MHAHELVLSEVDARVALSVTGEAPTLLLQAMTIALLSRTACSCNADDAIGWNHTTNLHVYTNQRQPWPPGHCPTV